MGARTTRKKTLLSAGVILVDPAGRILLQLRDDNPDILYPNHWGITGGNAARGETPEQAARREVEEETGVVLGDIRPFDVYRTELENGLRFETHFYYAITDRAVDDMSVGEGQALAFFRPEELDDLPLAYQHREVLADFIASPAYRSLLARENEALAGFERALERGGDWFPALLEAIARWEVAEEEVDGRSYRYLIGGEAFDWLLLAERLCAVADGAIPADEREQLLFFGKLPREFDPEEFRRAIGDAKHRAHLNFLYGVAVEEALQLSTEEEVLKDQRSCVWRKGERSAEQRVFDKLYGKSREELLAAFREERALPAGDRMSYAELREFTYWLFKYRVNQNDPARVASDTRKALAQLSELEAAAGRRARHLASLAVVDEGAVVDGVVVARER